MCCVHLFNQLISIINMAWESSYYSGRRRLCVPGMNMVWPEMCKSTSGQKSKTLLTHWLKLVRQFHHPQCPVPTRPLSERRAMTPEQTLLQMYTGTKTFISEDMSGVLMKQKNNYSTIMTIVTVWR